LMNLLFVPSHRRMRAHTIAFALQHESTHDHVPEEWRRARHALRGLLSITPSCPSAHSVLCTIQMTHEKSTQNHVLTCGVAPRGDVPLMGLLSITPSRSKRTKRSGDEQHTANDGGGGGGGDGDAASPPLLPLLLLCDWRSAAVSADGCGQGCCCRCCCAGAAEGWLALPLPLSLPLEDK
jgi:hypothetical protein